MVLSLLPSVFSLELYLLVLVFISLWILYYRNDRLGHLPGYRGLPVIGFAHKVDLHKFPIQITQHGKNFNGLFRAGEGVFIDKADVAYDIMVKQDPLFANRRMPNNILNVVAEGQLLTRNFDHSLQVYRKAAFSALHMHGSGRQELEAIVQEEVVAMLDEIEQQGGRDFSPKNLVYETIINIMTTVLVGQKFSKSSDEVKLVLKVDEDAQKAVDLRRAAEVYAWPWLLNLPFERYRQKRKDVECVIQDKEEIRRTFVENFRDRYISVGSHKCVLSSLYKTQQTLGSEELSDDMISCIMTDLIVAGTLTTATTLSGLLFVLANEPHVQDRIYQEITKVVGDGRMPTHQDKEKMPYTCAVIMEQQRYQSVTPNHVPRVAAADAVVHGHFIPQGTVMLINQWAIHHDPAKWEKPENFYPEHFLDDQGQILLPLDQIKQKGFMPFGAGRRGCIGETFGKSRLFLIVTSILQRYRLCPPESGILPKNSVESFDMGVVIAPPYFEVQFESRPNNTQASC